MRTASKLSVSLVLAMSLVVASAAAAQSQKAERRHAPSASFELAPATQGPFWPPAVVLDEDGNYLVVGNILTEVAPGQVVPIPGAALVSKNTVPPLDANGREDFSNQLGAPYDVIRPLDLSPGSPDLDIMLFASSMGPVVGDFGGGPRMPREGESAYNLNAGGGLEVSCPEMFPTSSQDDFTRKSFPLHRVPVWGFRGDQVTYDADTGLATPTPEIPIDVRRRGPITLGDYIGGERRVKITLTDWNDEVQAFTAARFDYKFRGLLPNGFYHASLLRTQLLDPRPKPGNPTSLTVSNMFVTDENGDAQISRTIPNPFPDPATDDAGLRVIGVVGAFHSDEQSWGGCPGLFGSSIDSHAFFNTLSEGIFELTGFTTKAAP